MKSAATATPPNVISMSSGVASIVSNAGMTLFRLAGYYPTITHVILEAVQNAVDPDVGASQVWIRINEKDRSVTITDNGRGIDTATFLLRLQTVCEEQRKGSDATGRFGIGLISPLGKCERFFFTSCPHPIADGYVEWRFECGEIKKSKSAPNVPYRARSDIRFGEGAKGVQPVHWRSMMRLEKVVSDPSIATVGLDDLVKKILTAHGNKMRRYETKVSISIVRVNGKVEERHDIQAPRFRGESLPEFSIPNSQVGNVVFRLFRSPLRTKADLDQGVVVGQIGDDFRMPFAVLARQIENLGVDKKALEALKSGVFEGEIVFEKLEPHVDRTRFAVGEALDGAAVAVSKWFMRAGSKAFEAAQEMRRDTKNVERAIVSLGVLERLLQEFPESAKAIQTRVKIGSVGEGHAKVPKTRGVGTIAATAVRGQDRGGESGSSGGDSPRNEKPTERKSHVPLTVAGPGGKERRLVRGNSTGLCVTHEMLEGDRLWEFDDHTGTLTFNVQHPSWAKAEDEGGDKAIYLLQEFCMLELVTMLGEPQTSEEPIALFSQKLEPLVMQWLIKGSSLRPKPAK